MVAHSSSEVLLSQLHGESKELTLVALLQVDEIYTVPEVGTVVGGTLSRYVHSDLDGLRGFWVWRGEHGLSTDRSPRGFNLSFTGWAVKWKLPVSGDGGEHGG